MADISQKALLERLQQLEKELKAREQDLDRYKSELVEANRRIENLIIGFEKDLQIAHSIQKALVPTVFPHIAGFEFSTKFVPSYVMGGDYFDIFELKDKLLFGLLMSSCSGHGLTAMLLSVLLKLTSQLEAKQGEPQAIVQRILKDMKVAQDEENDTTSHDAIDLMYGRVDRRHLQFQYARTGVTYAFHLSDSKGQVQKLEGDKGAVPLEPKDRLVFCSRGLVEAENSKDELFGTERLIRSLISGPDQGVHELRNHILVDLKNHLGAKEQGRDVSLIVLEVQEKVLKLATNSGRTTS